MGDDERAGDAPALRITLVHGTWARGLLHFGSRRGSGADAAWCAPGSVFRKRLESGLRHHGVTADIGTLRWSGANSIFERDRVAVELAESIERRAVSGVPELIIAHSHGGGVAMRAIELLARRKATLPAVATIATPFLSIEEGSLFRSRKLSFALSALFITAWVYAQLVMLFWPPAGMLKIVMLKWIGFPLLGLASYTLLRLITFGTSDRGWRLSEAATVGRHDANFRLLVVRGMEDEAGMALSLGLIGVRLSDLTSFLADIMWMAIAVFGLIAAVCTMALGLIAGGGMLLFGDPPHWASAALDAVDGDMPAYYRIATALGVFATATLLLPAIFKMSFGRELLVGSATLAVTANSVPDIAAAATVTTLGRARQGNAFLLHSLYDHEGCAGTIVQWAAAAVRSGKIEDRHTV